MLLIKVKIVDCSQLRTQNFIALVEVSQISPRKVFAGVAVTISIYWFRAAFVSRIPKLQNACAGEEMSVSRITGRHHTIKHINAPSHALEEVCGSPDSHEVVRFFCGEQTGKMIQHFGHLFLGFTDRQAAYRKAIKTNLL